MRGPLELDVGKSWAGLVRNAAPFVDRIQELAWLERWLQEAIAGRPGVVLMPGEAGIGKTRLLTELRSVAVHRGVQVYYGRCYEDLTLPYLPFTEALRPQFEHIPQELERTLGPDASIVDQLLYRQAATTPEASLAWSTQPDQDKLRLFLAVSHLIIKLAQSCPTLFVLDDLHWADQPSLDLFGHLVVTLAETAMRETVPLLLIGMHRPVDPEERLARLIARLQREAICHTLTLPGLHESEVHELIQGLGLARPSHQLTATVSAATQGNPLFVQEVFHHLVQQDALQERGGYIVTTAAPADLRLPEQVTSAIAARTQGLSEGCRRVLTLASILGERFSLQLLAAMSEMSEDELLDLLEESMRQRLLLSDGQTFQFAHPLIRHVFYNAPSVVRRQRIHRQIAQTLEQLYADSRDAHVLEIAHHLVRAGPAAEVAKVVEYARRAADQACTVFAWGQAALYYEAALSAAESSGRLSGHDRAELHYRAGLAYQRDTDVGPCLDHYEKAITAYRLTGDVPGLARALMERTRIYFTLAAVPYGTLTDIQPLEEVLEALGESEPGLRGSITAIISGAYWLAKQTDKARETAQRALEIGEHLQDQRLCAYACFALGVAYAQGLQVREALESFQDGVRYARQVDDPWLQGGPLQRMPNALILLGRLDEAETIAVEACEPSRKTQDWGHYSVALSGLASVAVARGDFAAVERYAHETMRMVSRSRYPWGGARALYALACARALRGAWSEAEDALDMLLEPGRVFKDVGPIIRAFVQVFRQLLRAHAGALDAVGETSAVDLVRQVELDHSAVAPICALIELGDLLAAPALTERPYQALTLALERGILFSNGWVFLIPRVLGVAAALSQRWDTAEAHFQAGIEAAARAGARSELGRTYLDYARMLVARGARGDARHAVELLKQASPLLHELGMDPFAQQATSLAERLQTSLPLASRPPVMPPDHLSTREVETLLQIAEGHSDQEIADTLLLGSTTVARHINSLFKKLGIESATAAAAYALEKGLTHPPPPHPGHEAAFVIERSAGEGTTERNDAPPQLTQTLRIILITDMESSTALIQRWGDAQAHELLRLHNTIIRDGLRCYHGFEVTHTGDGIEASFASAVGAVECALFIQRAFARHNEEHPDSSIHVRIGINAGEPIPTEGRLFGTSVHTAFRICARAQPGQILVSDVVRQLAAGQSFAFIDRGRFALKGLPKRIRLYEVQWKDERA